MRPFSYQRVADASAATQFVAASAASRNATPLADGATQFLAGGTTLLDLMKLDVMRPGTVIDITPLAPQWSAITASGDGLKLGALAKMSDVAVHETIQRYYPVIADTLKLAASAQLRNMATLGGNVLQRTRCSYFRDVSYAECNKRNPGSGCAALDGVNRMHAVLGTSERCIATYPGDFAQALIALDAEVEIAGRSGNRTIAFAELHKAPGATPQVETTLAEGELITGFTIPRRWPRSTYLKARDRQSYEFALAAAAVALELDGGVVRDARIALGGVATVPWRANEAEAVLKGQKLDEQLANTAGDAAMQGAQGRDHNGFKIALGRQVVARALLQAATMEI
jgi:xanthine dehydrogenase YagS FAD-binding subunit